MRLLSYPDFLERLAERVARLRERFGWLSGSKGRQGTTPPENVCLGRACLAGKDVTPLKINMEHNHGGLEDHFPFKMGDL